MKKMGLVVAIFFGVILLTSTVVIALPGLMEPLTDTPGLTPTGTPADNYLDIQRPQFCGTGNAKSTAYVQEYKIPTECTNPLAITTDYDGNVWFAQSNTGNLAKFDPLTGEFTEFENPMWPDGARTTMWGMDYSPDGTIWFTDDTYDSVWSFSTIEESYGRIGYPGNGTDTLPQKIQVSGSNIIFNDFTGGNLVVLTPAEENTSMFSIPRILNGSVTGDFAAGPDRSIWFTSWVPQDVGVLVRFDYAGYLENPANPTLVMGDLIHLTPLPDDASSINGIEIGADGRIWLADTSSSFFFGYDPITEAFTKFVTSEPDPSTYGNATGVIKSPASRPYWITAAPDGSLVFNEHNANRIAVFDPSAESLTEYMVPSKNPNWADCSGMADCGISQVFDFAVHGEKIWFTEWVENNIGVIDTAVDIPLQVELESDTISMSAGDSKTVRFTMSGLSQHELSGLALVATSAADMLYVTASPIPEQSPDMLAVDAIIRADWDVAAGQHKVLLGAGTPEVSISKFVTVNVLP